MYLSLLIFVPVAAYIACILRVAAVPTPKLPPAPVEFVARPEPLPQKALVESNA